MAGRKESARKPLCRNCKKNKPHSRGLCLRCGTEVSIEIRAGRRTEQSYIDSGILLPMKRLGRPPQGGLKQSKKPRRAS